MNKATKKAIIADLNKIYYRLDRAEVHNRKESVAELRGKLDAYGRMLSLLGYYWHINKITYTDNDLIEDVEIEINKRGE